MFDQALLIANSEADLLALARTVLLSTTSTGEKRQEKCEQAEIKCLVVLLEHEKQQATDGAKPSFDNISSLLDRDETQPILQATWTGDDDEAFRKSILASLGMRLTQITT